jgi:hypothetical protein
METCSYCGLTIEGQKTKNFAKCVFHRKCFKLFKKEITKKL